MWVCLCGFIAHFGGIFNFYNAFCDLWTVLSALELRIIVTFYCQRQWAFKKIIQLHYDAALTTSKPLAPWLLLLSLTIEFKISNASENQRRSFGPHHTIENKKEQSRQKGVVYYKSLNGRPTKDDCQCFRLFAVGGWHNLWPPIVPRSPISRVSTAVIKMLNALTHTKDEIHTPVSKHGLGDFGTPVRIVVRQLQKV